MIRKAILKELKETRGANTSYLWHFVVNFSRAACLMHKVLNQFRDTEGLLQEAMRNYVVTITSCLETFYRDLFLYVLALDEATLERLLPELRGKTTFSDMHSLLKEGVTFVEIAVAEASFQSVAEINSVMSKLFYPKSYLNELSAFSLNCMVPARNANATFRLESNWVRDLASIFTYRHSYVHDANRSCTIALSEMQRLETLALTVPQLTAELIATKLETKGMLRQGTFPALLLVEDLISEDWEVGDDKEAIQFT